MAWGLVVMVVRLVMAEVQMAMMVMMVAHLEMAWGLVVMVVH